MKPRHLHPLRRDRSQDEAWIRAFLHAAGAAVLTTVRDGRPYPIPILFAYDPSREAVYFHGGRKGRTRSNLASASATGSNPLEDLLRSQATAEGSGESGREVEPRHNVALTVFEMGRLLPAPEAAEFGVEYASVVVFGRGVTVDDPEESRHGLVLLMEKYAPHLEAGRDYRPMSPEEVARTGVFRVDILAWSGKAKRAPADAPGAYWLKDVRNTGAPGRG
jgi:hypothetical protein